MVHILEMEEYAKINNIPIMEKEGIEFLTKFVKEHNVKSILEIGSAIGYSAIKMALINEDIKVTTIERDEVRYKEAVKNINIMHLEDRINIILGDALETNIEGLYDLVFIDAAKSQYINFFNKYKINTNKYILSDNIYFHGLTLTKEPIKSRNVRGIVRKLNNYINFLNDNKEFDTEILSIGDGVAVSIKVDKDS